MGIQTGRGVETHNCRSSRECAVAMASRTGTYRFFVMKCGDVEPDDVQRRGVPILQQNQALRDARNFRRSYSNEEGEYCVATI